MYSALGLTGDIGKDPVFTRQFQDFAPTHFDAAHLKSNKSRFKVPGLCERDSCSIPIDMSSTQFSYTLKDISHPLPIREQAYIIESGIGENIDNAPFGERMKQLWGKRDDGGDVVACKCWLSETRIMS